MPFAFHASHMTVPTFQNEESRRCVLDQARAAAARSGYRGRVSFAVIPGQGGRPLVEVRVWPATMRQAG